MFLAINFKKIIYSSIIYIIKKMTTTRKGMIQEKYEQLVRDIEKYAPEGSPAFPKLDEFDITDVVFLFSMHFDKSTNIREKVLELFDGCGVEVDDKTFELGYPYIEKFVLWFQTIC